MSKFLMLLSGLALGCMSCDKDDPDAAPVSLEVSTSLLSFTGYHSTLAVKVDATRRWRAVASDFWITIDPDGYPSDGQHFIANVAVTVDDNTTGAIREGSISFYIGDEMMAQVSVTQDRQQEEDRPDEEFPISWANLQWAASTAILEGAAFEAGCCVFADGLTNAMESTTGEGITCDIGYSLQDSQPDGDDWTWIPCWFNGDWGDNFYYQGKIEGLGVGTYFYTFRLRNGNAPYKYAGTNGLWDGQENRNGTFTVSESDDQGDIDYSQYSITWANIQWTAAVEIRPGEMFEAGSKVLVPGLTDQEEASVDDKGIICEIGYSRENMNPSEGDWIWTSCPFNADWGGEFYFQGRTPAIDAPGTYFFTFRYKLGPEGSYVYAGSNGLWNGSENVNGTFTVMVE